MDKKQKIYEIQLTESEYNLLFMGLRHLELTHKGKDMYGASVDYKPAFRKLLNKITANIKQLGFF